jgi:hypothetical protein
MQSSQFLRILSFILYKIWALHINSVFSCHPQKKLYGLKSGILSQLARTHCTPDSDCSLAMELYELRGDFWNRHVLLWLFTLVCQLKHALSKEITISGSRNLLDTDFFFKLTARTFSLFCFTDYRKELYQLQFCTHTVLKYLLHCELGIFNNQLAQTFLRLGSIRGLITSNSRQLEWKFSYFLCVQHWTCELEFFHCYVFSSCTRRCWRGRYFYKSVSGKLIHVSNTVLALWQLIHVLALRRRKIVWAGCLEQEYVVNAVCFVCL